MSRIGKLPIIIPADVKVEINGQTIKVSGPKGVLEKTVPNGVKAKLEEGRLSFDIGKDDSLKPIYGTTRAIFSNMVHGVHEGWSKKLEMVGTGYRSDTTGKVINLIVGYSHPVKVEALEGITFKVEKNEITVEGCDKEIVGLMAAKIRAVRAPEPYKGKGIKYKDEVIRRKAGKAAKTAGAA
jgi:large subunit ribosomal protein L6